MENIATNTNYNFDFIKNLQAEISNKIAETANEEYFSKKNDLGGCFDNYKLLKLSDYNKILEKIVKCNDCLECQDINVIIDRVKTLINTL